MIAFIATAGAPHKPRQQQNDMIYFIDQIKVDQSIE